MGKRHSTGPPYSAWELAEMVLNQNGHGRVPNHQQLTFVCLVVLNSKIPADKKPRLTSKLIDHVASRHDINHGESELLARALRSLDGQRAFYQMIGDRGTHRRFRDVLQLLE